MVPSPTLSQIVTVALVLGLGIVSLPGSPVAAGAFERSESTRSTDRYTNFLPNLTEFVKPAVTVRSLQDLAIEVKLELPPNHEINRAAPGRIAIRSPLIGDALIAESPLDESAVALSIHWGDTVPTATRGDLVVEAAVYFCEEAKKGLCKIRSLRIFQPFIVDPAHGTERLTIQAPIQEK